jgi:dihydroorotate dehydrogenase
LIEDGGIINRMGFNNDGLEAAIEKLKQNKGKLSLVEILGKTQTLYPKITPKIM